MQHLPVAACAYDGAGRIHFWNQCLTRLCGTSEAEMQANGCTLHDLVHPEDRCHVAARIAAAGDDPYEVEYRLLRRDGTVRTVLERGRRHQAQDGNLIHDCVLLDVSERIQAVQNLHHDQVVLNAFVDHAPAAVAMFDEQMRYLKASRRWCRDYGLDDIALTGRCHYEIFPEVPGRWKSIHRQCLAGAVQRCEEDFWTRADGTGQWLRWEVRPWYRNPAEVGGILMLTEDITLRRKVELQLQVSERRLRAFLDAIPDLILRIHRDGTVLDHEAHSGDGPTLAQTFTPGQRLQEIIEPELAAAVLAAIERAFETEQVQTLQYTLQSNGESAEMEARIVVAGTEEVILIAADITERRRAEAAARKSQLDTELALKELASHKYALDQHAIVAATDPRGRITYANDRFCEISGYTREELIGQDHRLLNSRTHPPGYFADLWKTLKSGRVWRGEICNRTKQGDTYWVDTTITPFFDQDGRITQYVAIRTDVTERKRAEGELQETNLALTESLQQLSSLSTELELSRQAAEDASRAKSEFLANMSHEIRTPMTAILGYTDILRGGDGPVSEDHQREAVLTIQRNGTHLLAILNDILDLSKIEAGRMTVERIPCAPASVAADVASMMRPRADGKGLSLELVLETPVPRSIDSDPTRLRQILVNLVGNAIKFTEQGGVRIVLKVDQATGTEPTVQFVVADTGIGMSKGQVARLFKPFTQADASTTRKFGGTGLGLSIGKRLAELLGGDITVQSIPGAGSAFTLTLPAPDVDQAGMLMSLEDGGAEELAPASWVAAPDKGPALSGMRLLLAEDGPDNQRLISFRLRQAGAQVDVVGDGRAAVDAALAAQAAGSPFDLILMDMQMPELDGYGATGELRARGYGHPIVALTAHAMSGDRERCIAAGCDDYASKPIAREELLAVCLRWGADAVDR